MFLKTLRSCGLAAVAFFAFGCAGSDTAPVESVGLLVGGPAMDKGWNESAVLGLNELKSAGFGTTLSENVDGQAERVATLESYARSGYTYVIAHGFEFTDAVRDVSPRFPNVKFIQTNGDEFGPNWRSESFSDREVGYVLGFMAALDSASGKVGMILQKDESAEVRAAALHGVTDAKPGATLTIRETEDFDTDAYGQQAAELLIAEGVDSMAVLVDGAYPGVHTALAAAPSIHTYRLLSLPGLPSDQPEVHGGIVLHAGGIFMSAIKAYKDGMPTSATSAGFKEDALKIADFAADYPGKTQVQTAVQGIISGTITP